MTLGTDVFDAIYGVMDDAQGQIRHSGGETDSLNGSVEEAITAGVEHLRQHTEQGNPLAVDGDVRYKLTDEPEAWNQDEDGNRYPTIIGQTIEVLFPGDTDWTTEALTLRVFGRVASAGAVRLRVRGEFEEV